MKNRPTLRWHLQPYFAAFIALHRKRQVGFSALPIPGIEILVYLKIHDMEDDQEFFYKAISEMDAEFMSWSSKKAEEEDKTRKAEQKNKTRSPARRS